MKYNLYTSSVVVVLILLVAFQMQTRFATAGEKVEYCDLIENPEKYDGKRLTVSAVYNYGFEWQELLCMECRDKGKTWLAFNPESVDRVRRQLRKAPRHQGIVSGRFTGEFRGSGGPFGDGSYRFEFEVREVRNVKVLVRDLKTPLTEKVGSCKSIAASR